jgi:RHS repeat-associated protein
MISISTMSVGAPYVSHSSTERRYSIYSPALQLLAETATTSASAPPIAHEYIWFGGEPLAQVETTTGAVHWYFTDHLGAPVLTTDATGSIDWRVEREPYGAIYAVRAGAGRHQPLGLPGQEYDASSDRQYNVFRWYRAGWGRYTQSDPVGVVQLGFVSPPESRRAPINHLFGYVNASPTGAIDPLGLKPCASGQCSDCPSGVWTVEETSSVAYLTWGFEWEGTSTYRCWGNKLACSVYSKCQALGGGWTVGAGAGFGWIGGKTCSCAEDVTKTSSISGGAGPGYATWSTGPKCSGLTAGVATNFVKLSVPSAYLAGVVCSSKSMGCTK